MPIIDIFYFNLYKFFNSLFLGVSIGAVFILYTPLNPSIYSIGGIVLAIGILIISRFYHKILNVIWFFRISLFVEIVLLIGIIFFLNYKYNYQSALIIYIGYQMTFIFGSYLVRAETLILKDEKILTKIDTSKQFGYLLGMIISFGFYKWIEYIDIVDKQSQIYYLHFLLLFIEIVIIYLIFRGFRTKSTKLKDFR